MHAIILYHGGSLNQPYLRVNADEIAQPEAVYVIAKILIRLYLPL